MKCIILAAGYATRLYPLTIDYPKPLLRVGEKTILDWLMDDIDTTGAVDEYIVISNHKFFHILTEWSKRKHCRVTVIDDGTITNETRLGAVKDIEFAIDSLHLDDDMLVIAGDNLLDFNLSPFIKYAKQKQTSCVMRYYETAKMKLQKCGVLEIDDYDLITNMEEKPQDPKSNWCCPPFYYYIKEDAKKLTQGITAGCGTDAPGSFIAWLCHQTKVHAMKMPGKRYDIGTLESYEKIKTEYKGIIDADS